jgi:RNA polymerase sigma-70 factor (ECF subfamily)
VERLEEEGEFSAMLVAQLPRLRRYAIALIGDVSLADDLLQDCVERAMKNRRTLREEQRFYGWLRSILHNLYMDELRRRRRTGVMTDLDELVNSLMYSTASADRRSLMDFVQAMDRLSVEHRQILLLVGLDGLSYRETAEELNLPIGTVMSRLARAREHLRDLLDQTEERKAPEKGR